MTDAVSAQRIRDRNAWMDTLDGLARQCRPAAPDEGCRYHWIDAKGERLIAAWLPPGRWKRIGRTTALHPAEAHAAGWRYLAPCYPPRPAPIAAPVQP